MQLALGKCPRFSKRAGGLYKQKSMRTRASVHMPCQVLCRKSIERAWGNSSPIGSRCAAPVQGSVGNSVLQMTLPPPVTVAQRPEIWQKKDCLYAFLLDIIFILCPLMSLAGMLGVVSGDEP